MTGSYDPERDLLVWGAGNPKPDYDTDLRKGDNLYSNTALALRGTTGELVWHFQFTPHDDKDWDSNQVPILADLPGAQGPERRVLWANRNGFYYVLDRDTGKYLTSQPFVHQTWTAGIDPSGRPLPPAAVERKAQGYDVYPGNVGGTNWWPAAYDSERRLVFVPAIEQGMVFFPSARSWPRDNGKPFYTAVRALNAVTGKMVWEHKGEPRVGGWSETGGLLSTRTGLVFGGDVTTFFALDASTGLCCGPWQQEVASAQRPLPTLSRANSTSRSRQAATSWHSRCRRTETIVATIATCRQSDTSGRTSSSCRGSCPESFRAFPAHDILATHGFY